MVVPTLAPIILTVVFSFLFLKKILSAVGLGIGTEKGKMEDQVMKGVQEQMLATCSLILPLVHQWLRQLLCCLALDHFQASHQPFFNLVTVKMTVAVVMKKISKEARTLVTLAVLGIQIR